MFRVRTNVCFTTQPHFRRAWPGNSCCSVGRADYCSASMKLDRYEQSTGTRRLSGQLEQRSSQTGFPTWGLVLFGLPFAGTGIAVTLIGTKVMPVNPSSVHAP